MDTVSPEAQCISIKSKKNSALRCPNVASRGQFCAKHNKSKVIWTGKATTKVKVVPFTKRQKAAGEKIKKFLMVYGRMAIRRRHGPTVFSPSLSHNDNDIYNFDPITTIPLKYHFSFVDAKQRVWTFDMRFLIQLLQYGKDLVNPYSQERILKPTIDRLQTLSQNLRKNLIPIVYVDTDELTPEQIWNQKVLDVFLKITSLGYGVNILWFETMTTYGHSVFYRKLHDLWTIHLGLTREEKERIVPGHMAGRTPLFRWSPTAIESQYHELKWWRKQNLNIMNAFVSRSQDKNIQVCGALYILTALAQTLPKIAEVYPWLV